MAKRMRESRPLWAALILLAAVTPALADEARAPDITLRWSIDGGPYGSSRSLEPTMAVTPETVYVSANVTREDRRYQVIRLFGAADGRPGGMIEHPDGAAFEGFGEGIAVNDRFLVTGLHRNAGPDGTGELLVYDVGTFQLRHRIANPLGREGAQFGLIAPVLHGERVLASVTIGADNLGRAWVFSAETGEVLLTLEEPDVPRPWLGKPDKNFFGRALAMNATHIAVTANDREGPSGLEARGVVHVFDARDGALLHRLKTPAGDKAFGFGSVLVMSDDMLYVGDTTESGPLDWPTGQVHGYDLATGALRFTLSDPGVPESLEAFSAGKQGSGFPSALQVEKGYLVSGLPDWSDAETGQGGLIVHDARIGAQVLLYGHRTGGSLARFGQSVATGSGALAVSETFRAEGGEARRVMLFNLR